jgi:hypothetical protein
VTSYKLQQPLLKAGDKWSDFNSEHFCERLKQDFERTGNPICAWGAMRMCIGAGKPMPSWVTKYLAQCADRMLSEWDTSDLQAVLPRILGFPKKRSGPGKPLLPGPRADKLTFTLKFLNHILEGKDPKTAKADACNQTFGRKVADKIDDKTLNRYLLQTLGLQEEPNAQQWKALACMVARFDVVERLSLKANPTEADRERTLAWLKKLGAP